MKWWTDTQTQNRFTSTYRNRHLSNYVWHLKTYFCPVQCIHRTLLVFYFFSAGFLPTCCITGDWYFPSNFDHVLLPDEGCQILHHSFHLLQHCSTGNYFPPILWWVILMRTVTHFKRIISSGYSRTSIRYQMYRETIFEDDFFQIVFGYTFSAAVCVEYEWPCVTSDGWYCSPTERLKMSASLVWYNFQGEKSAILWDSLLKGRGKETCNKFNDHTVNHHITEQWHGPPVAGTLRTLTVLLKIDLL